ncbi:drug/metabolite transporter (DMT)-like permease [Bacilli bacterium PM5-3]|nr:drug/metabolite transporter (DMT)-like permease [Bacilli bacterium PM5-3]MDH6603909.1 drug/metabolite transporter (DMT)-like permease [Bacilli bacterium PM5-9]
MDKSKLAIFLLVIITFIWGYSFVSSSQLINSGVSSELLLFARFGIGAIALAIIGFPKIKKSKIIEVKAGVIVGLCIIFAMYMQNQSFNYTSISKSSFIASSAIIIVPFLAYAINKSSVTIKNLIGLALAMVGTIILSVDATTFTSINFGDLLAILSAFGFAFQIVLLAKFGKGTNAICVAFYQTLTVSLGGLLLVLINGSPIDVLFDEANIFPLLYLGLLATAICYIVQTWASKYVKEVVLSVIISAQALIAAFLDVIVLHNDLTSQLLIGGTLISTAIVYLVFDKENKKE